MMTNIARGVEHELYINDIQTLTDFAKERTPNLQPTQTLVCWCGEKFGPASFPNNNLRADLALHIANPPRKSPPAQSQVR